MKKRARVLISAALAAILCIALVLPLVGCSKAEEVETPDPRPLLGYWVKADGTTVEIDAAWMIVTRSADEERIVIAHSGLTEDAQGELKLEIFEWARKDQPGLSDEAPKWAITVVDSVTGNVAYDVDGDTLTLDSGDGEADFKVLDGTLTRTERPAASSL